MLSRLNHDFSAPMNFSFTNEEGDYNPAPEDATFPSTESLYKRIADVLTYEVFAFNIDNTRKTK